jgi:hypothetical protein
MLGTQAVEKKGDCVHCVTSKDFGNVLWFSKLLKKREQIRRKSENV